MSGPNELALTLVAAARFYPIAIVSAVIVRFSSHFRDAANGKTKQVTPISETFRIDPPSMAAGRRSAIVAGIRDMLPPYFINATI
jgi:hypothetical protein